jgi:hypothetical protein
VIAVDAGSNQISVLRILGDGSLSLVPSGVVSSGGIRADSIAVHGGLAYVANSGNGGSNYTGFQLRPMAATPAFQHRQLPDHRFKLPAKISRPSLMLATGITFSVHPAAL